jgi:hypothetical protein
LSPTFRSTSSLEMPLDPALMAAGNRYNNVGESLIDARGEREVCQGRGGHAISCKIYTIRKYVDTQGWIRA